MQAWTCVWSKEYGSPEFSAADPRKKGPDDWTVTAAKLSADEETVSLEIDGLKPVMLMRIQVGAKTAAPR